jgi:hypothetical protein
MSDYSDDEQAAESRGEAAGKPDPAPEHDQPAEGGDEQADQSDT